MSSGSDDNFGITDEDYQKIEELQNIIDQRRSNRERDYEKLDGYNVLDVYTSPGAHRKIEFRDLSVALISERSNAAKVLEEYIETGDIWTAYRNHFSGEKTKFRELAYAFDDSEAEGIEEDLEKLAEELDPDN